ncbi:MAG: acetyl-CoA decarbonylase/synthase complex subunit gamma [Actinobacteria bacterium]|nr:acetyl-CoA decarbonylase/synthase complex subunit gamma [Actinomycetota bacterium]
MALTGIAIYKMLAQTNCKECGYPTCLAFAMKLAARQVELSACPYVSEEVKAQLDSAAAPPVRLVSVGPEGHSLEVGNETVVYRHEKTFVHQPGVFFRLRADLDDQAFAERLDAVADYHIERVGQTLGPDGVAIEADSAPADRFASLVGKAAGKDVALILMASDPAVMEAGLKAAGASRPLIYPADAANQEAMVALAKTYKAPLVLRGADGDLEALANLADEAVKQGLEDLVLDPGTRGWADSLSALTRLRRAAIKKNFRPLGYPAIAFAGEAGDGPEKEAMLASQFIDRYAGFIVLDNFEPAALYSLLTLRQNIYTDPQKPIQVTPGLYEIGEPKAESPVLVTTNFSLTYFSVAGEVEGAGRPAWLLVSDSEGMSVLTAWAAGKFDAEAIGKAVKNTGIADKISHKKIVIPGAVATISGELEEELSGWEILVGPREAIGIPSYLRYLASNN